MTQHPKRVEEISRDSRCVAGEHPFDGGRISEPAQGVCAPGPVLAPVRHHRNEGSPMSTPRRADRITEPLLGLFETSATIRPDAPLDRHYFVPDDHGLYCVACCLPERNRRHAPRVA